MNLKEIRELVMKLMRQHGLSDWVFKWGTDKDMRYKGGASFGKCRYRFKEILLSRVLTENDMSFDRVKNTILHEIAHAIDFNTRGKSTHDDVWRKIAKGIGCNADETTSMGSVDKSNVYKWVAQCDTCNKSYYKAFRPKNKLSCSQCDKNFNQDYELDFQLNRKVVKSYESFLGL